MKKILLFLLLCTLVSQVSNSQPVFTGKPQYNILTIQNGDTIGITKVELFPNIAPLHVANFDSLVNVHFYDSTAFHRVIPGFMIQGGDPNSRSGPITTWGFGDPSQPTVNAEFSAARHLRGILSAARDTDTNSANSQFFICVAAASWLNGQYSVYGRVVSGMNYVDTIVSAPRDANDNPLEKIEMFITYVGSNDTVPQKPVLNSPPDASFSAAASRLLKWNAQPDGIIYTVQVATDSIFTNIVKQVNVGNTQYSATGLTPLTKYYWRVKTNNGGHFSNYSDVWSFYVSAVGVDEMRAKEEVVIVSPNPSKGLFTFSNLEKNNVIVISDVHGKIISSTPSDGNSFTLDLSALPKGVYFYSVIQDNNTKAKGRVVVEQ
jgi:cyclophilin family peptidyl-prolyl cis-trans isomerase